MNRTVYGVAHVWYSIPVGRISIIFLCSYTILLLAAAYQSPSTHYHYAWLTPIVCIYMVNPYARIRRQSDGNHTVSLPFSGYAALSMTARWFGKRKLLHTQTILMNREYELI